MQYGDICRAACGAHARYMCDGLCLYRSSMTNEFFVDYAKSPTGTEGSLPLPSDDALDAAMAGYRVLRYALKPPLDTRGFVEVPIEAD